MKNMSDELGTPETSAAEGTEPVGSDTSASSGGNPSWDSLRQSVGDVTFKLVEPHLKQFDQAAQTRVTDLNRQLENYSWARDLDQQRVQLAMNVADQLENNMDGFFGNLVNYYRQNNLPVPGFEQQQQAQQQELGEEPDELTTLRQQFTEQQQQLQNFFAMQEAQQQAQVDAQNQAQANEFVANEFNQLKGDTRFAQFGDADWQQVANAAALQASQAQNPSQMPNLGQLAEAQLAYRNQILGTTRPGAQAPRLLPTSGGVPSSASQSSSLGQLSRSDTQGLVAQILQMQHDS